MVNKIVEGKLEKFYGKYACSSRLGATQSTMTDLIGEYTSKIGEKLEVRRFVRFQLGEAVEQKAA